MNAARLLDASERRAAFGAREEAHALARRLPRAIVAARDIAASILHGAHGRRRAGVGDAFWQFRQYGAGESAARIDWRRSARDDRLYVREREWEAAHTIWLWIDTSPSMAFVSDLAMQSKLDRALLIGLAFADMMVRAGERVGLMGLTRALSTRDVIERFAETLLVEERSGHAPAELPPAIALAPRARALIVGDCLADPAAFADRIRALASRGARGHVVAVADPVEETFPFTGHVELRDVDSPAILRAGAAQSWREDYVARLRAHRAALADACRAHGFSFVVHRTDRPASEALIALRGRFEAGAAA